MTFQSFLRTVGIIVLAAAIVAIGAQELYKDQARRGKNRGKSEAQQMLNELKGVDLRARLRPDSSQIDKRVREQEEERTKEKRAEEKRLDRLEDSDKSALDRWIGGLSN